MASQEYDTKCLYIKGLSTETTEQDLERIFGDRLNLSLNNVKKLPNRTAIVAYSHEEDASSAISALNKSNLHGNTITVEYKTKRRNPRKPEVKSTWSESSVFDGSNSTGNDRFHAGVQNFRGSMLGADIGQELKSWKMDLDRLRFFSARHADRLRKQYNVAVKIDLKNSSVCVNGDKDFANKAVTEIKSLADLLVVKTSQPSEEFRKCFRRMRHSDIIESFKKHRVCAGWDLREGFLYVCSDGSQNVDIAFEAIQDLIVDVEYPTHRELSGIEVQAIVTGLHDSWPKLINKLKTEDPTNNLEIRYDDSISKVRFALRSGEYKFLVEKELDKFFKPHSLAEEIVTVDGNDAKVLSKNESYVSRQCSEDGVVIDFGDLAGKNICKITSQSAESLERSKAKLNLIVDEIASKRVPYSKSSHVAWLKSSSGRKKVSDIDELCKTTSVLQSRSLATLQRATPSFQPTQSAAAYAYTSSYQTQTDNMLGAYSTSSTNQFVAAVQSDVFKMVEVVKDDISRVKAGGLVSSQGVIAKCIERRRLGAGKTLKVGVQEIITQSGRNVRIYHTTVTAWEDSGEAKRLLGEKVRDAYKCLKDTKSIAYPAIGTGNLKYPAHVVAAVMISTVFDCLKTYRGSSAVKKVMFVIYPTDDAAYQAFTTELRKYEPIKENPIYRPVVRPRTVTTEELIVKFMGLKMSDVNEAKERLDKELRLNVVTFDWLNSSVKSCIRKLNEEEMRTLQSSALARNVDIEFMLSSDNITIEGAKADADAVRDEINRILHQKFSQISLREVVGLPAHWDHAVLERGKYEVRLDQSSNEFGQVSSKFFEAATNSAVRIRQILRIQNKHLYKQYQAQKDKVNEELVGEAIPLERELWHGTSPDAVNSIYTHGFNRSYAGKNGVAYGQGVYFSATSQESMRFCPGPYEKTMILAKAATGRYKLGNSCTTGKNLPSGYHSTVDSMSLPSIFVVYHDAAAYPEYVLTFSVF